MKSWNDDLTYGDMGETMVQRWLGGILGQDDLLVNVEIKSNWRGGQICIEEDSVKEQDKKGWIYTSKADNFIFLDYTNEQAVLITTFELRRVYEIEKNNYNLHEQTTERDGQTWTSTHRFIPLNKFCHTFMKYHQLTSNGGDHSGSAAHREPTERLKPMQYQGTHADTTLRV